MDRPIEIEELLSHAGWLRSLAASLVADPAHADDLVQETWIAALRHRPRANDSSPRQWLSRVVRNFAHNSRRTDARRDARELHARDERSSPSPASIAQEAEAQRLLAEAIAKLDEPLREVVVLRYFRGQDSNQIGKTLGIPSGTVRWRLKRALEELRAQLDRNFKGGREAWGAFLGSLLVPASAPQPILQGPEAGVVTSPSVATAIALKAAAVLLVAAGGVTAWSLVRSTKSADLRAEQSPSVSVAAPATAASEVPALAAVTPDRAPAPVTESGSGSSTAAAAARGIEFSGVILVDGHAPTWPISLMLKRAIESGSPRFDPVDAEIAHLSQHPFEVPADAGGGRPFNLATRIVLPEQRGAFSFGVLPSDWSGRISADGYKFEDGEIFKSVAAPAGGLVLRLRSLPAITCRVVDPESGLPIPGATYSCEVNVQTKVPASTTFLGKCDDEGRFRIVITDGEDDPDATVGGQLLLEAPDRGRRYLAIAQVARTEGVDLGDVKLEPARAVTFHLRDQWGKPIRGGAAKLEDTAFTTLNELTDDNGASVLWCVPTAGASARFGAMRYEDRVVTVAPGEVVDVTLERTASLEVQLMAPQGSTLPATRIIVRAQQRMFVGEEVVQPQLMFTGFGVKSCNWRGTREKPSITLIHEPDDDGRILLTGLLPNVPFQIEVRDSADKTLVLREESVGAQEWRRIEIPIAQ